MLVALRPGQIGARELSRSALVLARPRAVRPRLLRAALLLCVLAALLAGAGGAGYAMASGFGPIANLVLAGPASAVVASGPVAALDPLRQELEQSRLGLRMAEARAQELERQVDALNQRLRESNEQLAFLRTARDGHRTGGR
jgi:hypothetical protein